MTTMTAGYPVSADRRAPFVTALVAGAGCVYLALNDPNDPGVLMPACPTKLLTGLDCPACGGLRMVRALLYADVRAAARANLLLLLLVPAAIAVWAVWCRDAVRGRPRRLVMSRPTAIAVLTIAAAWTVVRNLT